MPRFYSHDFPRIQLDERSASCELPGVEVVGATLGEFLSTLERATGIRVSPHDPPKYFRYYSTSTPDQYLLVDVHIEREGVELCPKQDLAFQLEPGDIVSAGVLAC